MGASLIRVMASAVAVAIVAFPAVRALPDSAPASTTEASAPSAQAPVSTPSAEKAAPPSATESPAAAPEAAGPPSPPSAETLPIFKAEQLDQLLAPIALYPDALLAQILMAATYPLEVVKADRWLQDPAHANLQGDQLAAAIAAEPWDPSVKSLVAFPQILRMMDQELDWTEQLGSAVVAQQGGVLDSIQHLRYQAAAAGTLWSNAEQRVTTERQGIVIEPANPEFIYPPVYRPAVYGPWPYPDYPAVDIFPPDYGVGLPPPFGIGFGMGFAVVQPLWRWCAFDWGQRGIQLNVETFNALNHHRNGIETGIWRHDMGHPPSAPYDDLASRARLRVVRGPASSAAAIPRVNVTSADAAAEPSPTSVLRSPAPGLASERRGFQGRSNAQLGPASPRVTAPPIIRPGSARLMSPRTATRSTAGAPGSRAPVEGMSRR